MRVPRSRFAPVKTTSDLLAIRSDAYVLNASFQIGAAKPGASVVVALDPTYYKLVDDLEKRFPHGPPSLVDCQSLRVTGDVYFGANVRCIGAVEITNSTDAPMYIDDDAVLR